VTAANDYELVLVHEALRPHAGLALLTWRQAACDDRLTQVYVDGRWYDTTDQPTQRQRWLELDRSIHHRIELLAVAPADRWTDFGSRLTDLSSTGRVSVALTRDSALDIDSAVQVYVDGQLVESRPMWTAADPRAGFGGAFGIGEFGRDEITGPGHALGAFGVGPFGSDGQPWRWADDHLAPGMHEIDVRIIDTHGRIVGELDESIEHEIAEPMTRIGSLTIDDGPTGLTLRWSIDQAN